MRSLNKTFIVFWSSYAAFVVLFLAATFLSSCASMGVPAPRSVEQSIAYTQGGLTTAYQTVGDLVVQGSMTIEQRDKVVARLDEAYTMLKAAKAANKADDKIEAANILQQAQSILTAMQSVLQSWGKK